LEEKINLCIKSYAPISELLCGHIGISVAELQEEANQDPHSSKGLELLKTYGAAAKIYQAAAQAEAAAKKEMCEKCVFVSRNQDKTKEHYLTESLYWKAKIVFIEKVEQRYPTECERNSCYVVWMKYKHGTDSKETQIAQHRAELAHTREFVHSNSSPYWIKWDKVNDKAWLVYYQFRAEGYDNIADELDRSRKLFCDRIKANGEALSN
ncbi:uncharacterized protein TM35_000921120, partial [Trypanosoma theileri]